MELITATKQCEGQVVDKFPLRQYLGETENSTVFLTDRNGRQQAAIKFVAAEGAAATKQLAYWKRAAQLSHANLLKIFETGGCQLGGQNQVYVVMEYAEENLGEILPQRALSAAEARDMLGPLLDALGYLHANGFVHGQVKPGNILASNNELKLSSDSVRQAGEPYPSGKKRGQYDAPEAGTTMLSASADVWSLGITLVEVLTQRVPDWETRAGDPVVPASLPEPFRDIARNCLQRDPNARWTIPQVKARLAPQRVAPSSAPAKPAAPSSVQGVKRTDESEHPETKKRNLLPVAIAIVALLAIVGLIAVLRSGSRNSETRTSEAPPRAEQQGLTAAKPQPGQTSRGVHANNGGGGQADVIQQVRPKISPNAQRTIRGTIKLRVRVHVNPGGDVTRADLVSAGPSQYFARLVMEAARQWKFSPTTQQGERRWMLHFDLTRRGTSASAEPIS